MNQIIDNFRYRLHQINNQAQSTHFPNLADDMAKIVKDLHRKYGDPKQGTPAKSHIELAVINYLTTRQLSTYRDVKLVCFGLSSEYGQPSTRLIEQDSLFIYLLINVKQLESQPRQFRRCYQGLLKSYFSYQGQHTQHAIGRRNWLALRDFLADYCSRLTQQQPVIEWTQALYEHRNLLGENPCKPYGKALLAGDNTVVEELKNRLGIDDNTWVMNELVLAQVQAATELSDAEFKSKVTPLLKLLEKHTGLLTRGLVLLLKRYEACSEPVEQIDLRDAALKAWKSPWLDVNKPIWHGQIGESATKMVSLWLNRQSIREFFELLQANGQADIQRMEFWLKYAEMIDEIWLALGQQSIHNPRADYVRIRRNMEGRYMALVGGNYVNDNAFMMVIGRYLYIEFGRSKNACYVFVANDRPFNNGQKQVIGGQAGLKNRQHPGYRKALLHQEGWQRKFDNFIGDEALRSYCEFNNLPIEDHRNNGGAIWINVPENHTVAVQLQNMGFTYRAGKGWWR